MNSTAAGWVALAVPDDRKRESWARAADGGQFEACGVRWDAVAIQPMTLGLQALDRMRMDPRSGCPVLADHARDELYVMVVPRTFPRTRLPGVRLLSHGAHLGMPTTRQGTEAADWLSAPKVDHPPLVRADQLFRALKELTSGRGTAER
ncbi:hypothetical protein [Streptomyces triculaminicus]|uniref:hypothetical protein n=1 Tax=Streptomyces triculaminicus TaxID=2816232 RepID=UPI0037B7E8B3